MSQSVKIEYGKDVPTWIRMSARTGVLTGTGAGGTLFSLRNTGVNTLVGIRRCAVQWVATVGPTAGQLIDLSLFFARSFTAADSAGTAISFTTPRQKVSSGMADPQVEARIATTASVTAGTRTPDPLALCSVSGWIGPAATSPLAQGAVIPLSELVPQEPDAVIWLAKDEGILVSNGTAMGAALLGTAIVNIDFVQIRA